MKKLWQWLTLMLAAILLIGSTGNTLVQAANNEQPAKMNNRQPMINLYKRLKIKVL